MLRIFHFKFIIYAEKHNGTTKVDVCINATLESSMLPKGMTMSENDRRFQRTHKLIRDVFEEMFMEQEYSRITVKDLCSRININRKTFYHHFNSLEDLLTDMLSNIVNEIMAFVDNTVFFGEHIAVKGVVPGFYRLLSKRKELHKRILCSPECYSVFEKASQMLLKDNISRLNKYLDPADFKKKSALMFMTYSVLPIYREWLITEPEISEDELGAMIEDMIINGSSKYLTS